ncbi:MAG: chloramphenicol phosphotransferase [Geminicoccaceae bacterium]
MARPARIVLLNGVGSAGKTSIARELQAITVDPFLHVQMDAFLDMMPERYQSHPDGILFETLVENGRSLVAVRAGALGALTLKGMRRSIAAMAGQGLDLIVDEVLLGGVGEYRRLLTRHDLFVVGVLAPLDILESRERARGDRLVGLARWQFDRVHKNVAYDFEVDTSTAGPAACARRIKSRFGL